MAPFFRERRFAVTEKFMYGQSNGRAFSAQVRSERHNASAPRASVKDRRFGDLH